MNNKKNIIRDIHGGHGVFTSRNNLLYYFAKQIKYIFLYFIQYMFLMRKIRKRRNTTKIKCVNYW